MSHSDAVGDGNVRDLYRAREAVQIERRRVRKLEAEVFLLRAQLANARAALERRVDYSSLLP